MLGSWRHNERSRDDLGRQIAIALTDRGVRVGLLGDEHGMKLYLWEEGS